MVIHNYKFKYNENGYITGFEAVEDNDYDYTGQLANMSDLCKGWYKFINGSFIVDDAKKNEIEAKEKDINRKSELEELLKNSDYIIARTFEQVMSCTNPLTFITDIIAIITKFSAQYGEVIANRQTWRDELEAMEATNNE